MFSLKHSFLETKSKTFFIVIMMMTGKNVLVLYDELQNVDAYLPSLSNTWKASLKSCSGSTWIFIKSMSMSILLLISVAIYHYSLSISKFLSSSCLFSQFNLVGHMCEELVELNAALPVGVHVLQQVVHLVVRRKHS